jgi:hypothetical protein
MYSQKWNCAASWFPKQNYIVMSPNFYIHVSVSDLYILRSACFAAAKYSRQTDPGKNIAKILQ